MVMFTTHPGLRAPARAETAHEDSEQGSMYIQNTRCNIEPQLLVQRSSPHKLLGLRGGGPEQPTRESNTGTEFPEAYCHLSKTDCPTLVGVGSRRKRLLGFKQIDAYALGLYVDAKSAKKMFSGGSKSEEKLCKDVLDANELEKTLRIVVTSKMVNNDRFISSLKEVLAPACDEAGDTESLPEFEKLFDGIEIKKGLELAFTSTKQGALAARIDSRDVGEVRSKNFTNAFFSLYLGDSPVSPEAKKSIGQGLVALASQSSDLNTETA